MWSDPVLGAAGRALLGAKGLGGTDGEGVTSLPARSSGRMTRRSGAHAGCLVRQLSA